ncbi:hypothetical protein ABZ815_35155 [Nonomuraea sp. NPDC047529]|uniref:hypothetical protein n=1 Tax=Nonomuraea sp. NPDC047529 TaxID=3155623 RepID=UPI0033DAA8D8
MQHAPEQTGGIRAWERVAVDMPGPEFEPFGPFGSFDSFGPFRPFGSEPPRPQGDACPDAGLPGASASTVGASEACRAAVWAVNSQPDEDLAAPDLTAALRRFDDDRTMLAPWPRDAAR